MGKHLEDDSTDRKNKVLEHILTGQIIDTEQALAVRIVNLFEPRDKDSKAHEEMA